MIKLLGTSCLCYNNNCITKLWAPGLNLFIHTWFIDTAFYNSFQYSPYHSKLKYVVLNSYENFKLTESTTQINPVESFRTHRSSESSGYCHILTITFIPLASLKNKTFLYLMAIYLFLISQRIFRIFYRNLKTRMFMKISYKIVYKNIL